VDRQVAESLRQNRAQDRFDAPGVGGRIVEPAMETRQRMDAAERMVDRLAGGFVLNLALSLLQGHGDDLQVVRHSVLELAEQVRVDARRRAELNDGPGLRPAR
jgi:hypothetical protein